jgi:hypothetical protein
MRDKKMSMTTHINAQHYIDQSKQIFLQGTSPQPQTQIISVTRRSNPGSGGNYVEQESESRSNAANHECNGGDVPKCMSKAYSHEVKQVPTMLMPMGFQ